jgi:arsenate reductase
MPLKMKKVFSLSTCDTSRRILKECRIKGLPFEIIDIKANPITEEDLDELYKRAGSYEALFSRRAQKYKSLGLKNVDLKESDYKRLILEDYTFLKRPVILDEDQIFIGNSKANVSALSTYLKKYLSV